MWTWHNEQQPCFWKRNFYYRQYQSSCILIRTPSDYRAWCWPDSRRYNFSPKRNTERPLFPDKFQHYGPQSKYQEGLKNEGVLPRFEVHFWAGHYAWAVSPQLDRPTGFRTASWRWLSISSLQRSQPCPNERWNRNEGFPSSYYNRPSLKRRSSRLDLPRRKKAELWVCRCFPSKSAETCLRELKLQQNKSIGLPKVDGSFCVVVRGIGRRDAEGGQALNSGKQKLFLYGLSY